MIKLSRFSLSILCLLIFFTSKSSAQTADTTNDAVNPEIDQRKFYDVELVIFKFNKPANTGEVNLPTPSAIRTKETIDFSLPKSINKASELGFTPLRPEDHRLQQSVLKITKSSRYTLLTHTGWRQPGLGENESIPVWITGGKIYGKGYSSIDQVMQESEDIAVPEDVSMTKMPEDGINDQSVDSKNIPTNAEIPQIERNEFYELDGQVTIILSRYLHTKSELVFRRPANNENVMLSESNRILTNMDVIEGQLLLNYGLHEKRRMRSKKLHYMDNPQFGMLVLITPYKVTETPDEEGLIIQTDESSVPELPGTVIAQ